jgi:hypothetical protein
MDPAPKKKPIKSFRNTSPFTIDTFKKSADTLVQGSLGGMKRGIEGIKLLKDTMDELINKALDSGVVESRQEAIEFILGREKYYMDLIESEKAKGVEVPVLKREEFKSGSETPSEKWMRNYFFSGKGKYDDFMSFDEFKKGPGIDLWRRLGQKKADGGSVMYGKYAKQILSS